MIFFLPGVLRAELSIETYTFSEAHLVALFTFEAVKRCVEVKLSAAFQISVLWEVFRGPTAPVLCCD